MELQFYTKEKDTKFGFVLAPFSGIFETENNALTWFHKYGLKKEKSIKKKLILAPAVEEIEI